MRVPCEQPRETKSDTLDVLSGLERQLSAGEITPAEFVEAKSSLSKKFFGRVMEVEKLPRAISMLNVQVQVRSRVKLSMKKWSRHVLISVDYSAGAPLLPRPPCQIPQEV